MRAALLPKPFRDDSKLSMTFTYTMSAQVYVNHNPFRP